MFTNEDIDQKSSRLMAELRKVLKHHERGSMQIVRSWCLVLLQIRSTMLHKSLNKHLQLMIVSQCSMNGLQISTLKLNLHPTTSEETFSRVEFTLVEKAERIGRGDEVHRCYIAFVWAQILGGCYNRTMSYSQTSRIALYAQFMPASFTAGLAFSFNIVEGVAALKAENVSLPAIYDTLVINEAGSANARSPDVY
ncbi:hypothetical protein DFJ73DRAFT_771298 [Zopfochytrium polystomum]|nr:hypothetical protein DFJ73DRAFT_771298 [Zopfochytrium polystomum]